MTVSAEFYVTSAMGGDQRAIEFKGEGAAERLAEFTIKMVESGSTTLFYVKNPDPDLFIVVLTGAY